MKYILGIDPGGEHVGWAEFRNDQPVEVRERTPEAAEDALWDWLALRYNAEHVGGSLLIIESFRLYPDKAKSQIGSDMPTSQLIGSMRYMARYWKVPVILQPAAIKEPTESLMRRRGIVHTAVQERQGGHAKDAETHVWHHLLRNATKKGRHA